MLFNCTTMFLNWYTLVIKCLNYRKLSFINAYSTQTLLTHFYVVPRCKAIAVPANGAVNSTAPDHVGGTVLRVSCTEGYDFIGEANSTTCTSDMNNEGIWSPNPTDAMCGKRPYR